MVLNETGLGDPTLLVDEQGSVGDPATGHGLAPQHPFFPGWTAWYYPVQVMIDLGSQCHVTRLFFYNESGQNDIVLSDGTPTAWKPHAFTLGGYKNWQECRLDTDTRYLRITLPHPMSLPEVVAYGQRLAAVVPLPPPHHHTTPPMESFLGLNAFIDDPADKIIPAAGFVREYHDWGWDVQGPDGRTRFQPSAAGGGGWFFDDYYRRLTQGGVMVCPAIQGNLGADANSKPIPEGANAEDPASYAAHAAHLFQYAARYGHRAVPDRWLTLAPGQPRRSGLGLLRDIENWNEPDATWHGRAGYFTPYELAALCSADYDGDRHRLGPGYGVKNADPWMRLVVGGLAGVNLDYLRAMKLWADVHRGGSFPADVLNLHHYCSTGNEQGFQPNGAGISPEADHLREKLAVIAAWRDRFLPDKALWVTEFGYDTDPRSPLHAPSLGTLSAPQVQAAWLVRSYLALAAAGVDRAAMFMLRDTKSDGGGVFETCGLVTEKGQWNSKPSWYYLATLKRHLAGTHFAAEVPSGRADVRIYRFDALAGGGHVYAVWCPTSEDKHVGDYRFPRRLSSATAITLADRKPAGVSRPLPIHGGVLTLQVSETPLLLRTPE